MTPFTDASVARTFASYPLPLRVKLFALRERIFAIAATTPGVGELEETLKWGEPAYLTPTGSGTTIRIAWKASRPNEYALYFNCQTKLLETFRTVFPGAFNYQGNRAIVFTETDTILEDALRFCIVAALTYHQNKGKKTFTPGIGSKISAIDV